MTPYIYGGAIVVWGIRSCFSSETNPIHLVRRSIPRFAESSICRLLDRRMVIEFPKHDSGCGHFIGENNMKTRGGRRWRGVGPIHVIC